MDSITLHSSNMFMDLAHSLKWNAAKCSPYIVISGDGASAGLKPAAQFDAFLGQATVLGLREYNRTEVHSWVVRLEQVGRWLGWVWVFVLMNVLVLRWCWVCASTIRWRCMCLEQVGRWVLFHRDELLLAGWIDKHMVWCTAAWSGLGSLNMHALRATKLRCVIGALTSSVL